MDRKKLIIAGIGLLILVVIYFPGFSKFQQLKDENESLERQITDLKRANQELQGEIEKLTTDPVYVEKIAREKMKKTKKGEIVYKTQE